MRRDGTDGSEPDALQAYLRAIATLPRLTAQQERDLGRRIKAQLIHRRLHARVPDALGELRSYLN
jgi:hypothetical protein